MKNTARKILMWICIVVLIGSSGILLWQGFERWQVWKGLQEVNPVVEVDDRAVLRPDWEKLKKENPDVVGWVYMPNTDISFPIVQEKTRDYYLNHTFKGESNRRGAIFLYRDCPSDFSGDNNIVLGHSVNTGGMFSDLKDFEKKAYFEDHPYFYILTPEANYKCMVYTFAETVSGSVFFRYEFGDHTEETLKGMKKESMYHTDVDPKGKRLVSLATCDLNYGYHSSNRLVLTAVMDRYYDPVYLEEAE